MSQEAKRPESSGEGNNHSLEVLFSALEKGLAGRAYMRSAELLACLQVGDWEGAAKHLSWINRVMDFRNQAREIIEDGGEEPAVAKLKPTDTPTEQVVIKKDGKESASSLPKERAVKDLGKRELGAVRALLALDETKTGFLYPGIEEDWKPVARVVFEGDVDSVGAVERITVHRAVQSLIDKLPKLEKADQQADSGHYERYRQLMEELRQEEVYKKLKASTLVRLMRRDRALPDIPQKKVGEKKSEVQDRPVKNPEPVTESGKGVVDPTNFAPLGNFHPEALEGIRREGGSIVRIHDLRDRQAMIAFVPFQLNAEKSGFRYQNLEESLEDVFQDKLEQCGDDQKQKTRMKGMYSCNARESFYSVDRKLLALIELEGAGRFDEVLALSPRLGGFIRDVREYEGGIYSTLNLTDLRKVYRREITAEEMLQQGCKDLLPMEPDTNNHENGLKNYALTPAEVYQLASVLISQLPEDSGIKIDGKAYKKLEDLVRLTDIEAISDQLGPNSMQCVIGKMRLLLDPQGKERLFTDNMGKDGEVTLAQIAIMCLAAESSRSLELLISGLEKQTK